MLFNENVFIWNVPLSTLETNLCLSVEFFTEWHTMLWKSLCTCNYRKQDKTEESSQMTNTFTFFMSCTQIAEFLLVSFHFSTEGLILDHLHFGCPHDQHNHCVFSFSVGMSIDKKWFANVLPLHQCHWFFVSLPMKGPYWIINECKCQLMMTESKRKNFCFVVVLQPKIYETLSVGNVDWR